MNKLADREAIGELLRQGLPHKEIARLEGCSSSTVAKVSGELGLQRRRYSQYCTLSEEKWERLVGLWSTGTWTITELASLYQVSRASIYKRFHNLNLL